MNQYIKEVPWPETKFLTSMAEYKETDDLENKPAVAFLGRSNSGKSSLLNALTNHRGLAKVSKTPGKTKLINVFKTNRDFFMVDLPGFGYSKASHKEHKDMMRLIDTYLNQSTNLKILCILCDSQRQFPEEELQMVEVCFGKKILPVVIRTKFDKLNQKNIHESKKDMEKAMNDIGAPFPVFYISSTTGKGIGDLKLFLLEKLGVSMGKEN